MRFRFERYPLALAFAALSMPAVGKPAKPWREVPVEQLLENQGWVDA